MGPYPVAVVLDDVVGCILAFAWYRRGMWAEKVIDDTAAGSRVGHGR